MAGKTKQPKIKVAAPPVGKVVVSHFPTREQSSDRISWRFGQLDLDGPWGWHLTSETDLRFVHDKLSHMERLTWDEAKNPKGMGLKPIPRENIIAKARARLREIQADDADLVEFHLGGEPRVWGRRCGNVCHLLWWDPNHEVCPAHLKHT